MSASTAPSLRVEREDLNPCTVLLKVSCSPDQVQAGVRKAVKTLAKKIRVQGFRPGTAPMSVLEKMIPSDEINAMAQEETINSTFKAAVQGEGLELGGQAQIESVEFDREKDKCDYTVKVPLAPKVTLGEYKGLEAERYTVSVTDTEVDRQVDELRSRSGKKKSVDRGVREGDNALVNLKVDGAEGDGRNFMLVAGQTFPDLDTALLGMKQDDIKSVELQFPEAFQEADLAGKKVKCTLTVRSVSAVELPDADDEFAKSLNIGSLDQLKERIRENVLQAKKSMAQDLVNERLLDQLLAKSEVHVSDTSWESVVARRVEEIKNELHQQGATLEQYAKQNGMDEAAFLKAQAEEAKTQVQRAVLIEKIFQAEGMKVSDQDANEQFIKIAWENRVPEDGIKKFAKEYGPQIRDEIVYRTMYSKVLALLNEHAKITEIDPPGGSQ